MARRNLASVICAFAAVATLNPQVFAQPLDAGKQAAISGLLAAQRDRTRVPGIALIVRRHGEVAYARSLGIDGNGVPFTVDTPVYLGSLSKSFTAVAVMQLVAARRVDLNRPVVAYLPEFVPADPRGARITVRHLLMQTSGLTDANLPDWSWPWPRSFADATRRAQRVTRLATEPGTHHAYHNANYMLLGDLVERSSGETFPDYLQHHVFEPLGLHSARAVNWIDAAGRDVPPGHVFLLGHPVAIRAPGFFVGGAGGVIASVADLSRWLELFTHDGTSEQGQRLLPSGAVAGMLQPESASPYQYQYGWVVRQPRTRLVRHNGGLPTFTAHAAFAPDDSLAIAVVVNASPANPAWSEIGEEVADGVVAILDGGTPIVPSNRFGLRVEQVILALTVLLIAYSFWLGARAQRWRERRRLVPTSGALYRLWARALLLPSLVVVVVFIGIPAAVSFVESWSWLWLWYYSPTITGCLWLLATAAATLVVVRSRNLLVRQ